MNIALAHFRVGETDGVSLEMEKWKIVLEKLGHRVYFIAGSKGESDAYVIDELHYLHPENNRFVENCYGKLTDYSTEKEVKEDILNFAERIENKLIKAIHDLELDMIIPNNIWSLGWGLPAGIAFTKALQRTGIKAVAHHHDFHWERDKYENPVCSFVPEWLNTYFPPDLPEITHAVINRIAQDELMKRRGITSKVVPNVFDFSEEPWSKDDYNADFKKKAGLKEQDVLVLQATRIAERKAIELGIDVVAEMQSEENLKKLSTDGLYDGRSFTEDSEIVYVLAGLEEASEEYITKLKEKAERKNVKLKFINHLIESQRTKSNGTKMYSLWDAYVHADVITYPSILEGWGNQLLEGIYAKKPMVIYEYPVYVTDLKQAEFQFATLGNTHEWNEDKLVNVEDHKVESAAKELVKTLTDPDYRERVVTHNFETGKKLYSYEALKEAVERVLSLSVKG
ncbi:glycosyltransferase family 4 protein [Salipaludibacillus aurantiacus]|uniref:Glycosyltransferase involved in cell wall bisynthesis n=1 Tax=Salipaludibacillus aurantiacus TaxID=1601833 RepID=A0A1H9SES5_9BACI|nr:glycosyltransferase family 4 protein [Salipaludibacillus aurantiacus]SER83471.1 Glycosyltransferase involved in cell wall bisynthesis [Salipaludibacillus aurantiacus]